MIERHHREAYFKGMDDAKAGITSRLEICQDPKEYEFYLLGQKDAKVPPKAPVKQVKNHSEEVKPIAANLYKNK